MRFTPTFRRLHTVIKCWQCCAAHLLPSDEGAAVGIAAGGSKELLRCQRCQVLRHLDSRAGREAGELADGMDGSRACCPHTYSCDLAHLRVPSRAISGRGSCPQAIVQLLHISWLQSELRRE